MYTPDQYKRASSQLASATPDMPRYAEIKQKVAEFERYNPDHATIGSEDLHAQSGEVLKSEASPLPALPPESPAQSAGQFGAKPTAPSVEVAPQAAPAVFGETEYERRQSAKQLLSAPPEYVSKRPLNTIQQAAGALVEGGGLLTPASTSSHRRSNLRPIWDKS
jgi:hypothetical protein